jgi:hypothetical protein
MTIEEYEQLPPEEKEHFAMCGKMEKYLIGAAWTKCCFIPTISTGPTFSIPGQ